MHSSRLTKAVVVAALAVGVGGGSYGVASAASGNSTATTTGTTPVPRSPPSTGQPWGGRRLDETLLTGDALAKVEAAALAEVAGGTIVRIETDADGHAKYEAHMTDASGTPVTVYVDASFNVVSTETR
jgi:hypothetical protein